MTPCLTYDESLRHLQQLDLLHRDESPTIPDHLPQPDDDEPLGISFFRTGLQSLKLENLTLPRTFFGRSEITRTSFRNTDLTESNLCWNDFADVDFTDALLTNSDLRASVFENVNFIRTDLRGADLRHSTFAHCTFESALMDGAILARKQATCLNLDRAQLTVIRRTLSPGPEPPGG